VNRLFAILMIVAMAAVTGCRTVQTPRPYVFGINSSTSDRELQAVKAAGGTNIRIGCGWDLIEKTPGVYDFRDPDRDVAACMEYGLEPFFLVVATPKWALSPEKRDQPWGHAPEPEFYPEARRFYRMLAARYRGQVRYYEFWNEQNGYGWHAINRPEEYAPILKVAYEALKEGNPDCLVAVGGLDGAGWKGYPTYLERLYELGCGDYFDAVAAHPYRSDGPIDTHSLHRIHEILVSHGHGHRKLWLTEYGWSNEFGHDNKARWLRESLELLTSPDLDFVFQASIHTLTDFDRAEYGMCARGLQPRAAFQVFKDFPKDWDEIAALHAQPEPESLVTLGDGSFELGELAWTPYGDGMEIRKAEDLGIRPEDGEHLLAAPTENLPRNGGVFLQVEVPEKVLLHLSARAYSDQRGDSARNSRCRVGLDPTGGTDPAAATVVWGRTRDTSGAWDTVGVGHGDPVYPQSGHVTLLLEYMQEGGNVGQKSAFDQVVFNAREAAFELPEVEPLRVGRIEPRKIPALPEPPPVAPEELICSLAADASGIRDSLENTVGTWDTVEGGWLRPRSEEGRRYFIYATATQELPDENWALEADVYSEGELNVALWAGKDMDHCLMALLDSNEAPVSAYFIERDGEGIEGFKQRTNKNTIGLAPGEVQHLSLVREGKRFRLLIDGNEVTRHPCYEGSVPRFGLFALRPGSALFGNVRVVRK
jgi:hypothetical protein